MIEDGALRVPRRAARPDDRDRSARIGCRLARGPAQRAEGAEDRAVEAVELPWRELSIALGDQDARPAAAEDARDLAGAESGIHARGDCAEPHCGLIADRIVDGRGDDERDDVSLRDAEVRERSCGPIGGLSHSANVMRSPWAST